MIQPRYHLRFRSFFILLKTVTPNSTTGLWQHVESNPDTKTCGFGVWHIWSKHIGELSPVGDIWWPCPLSTCTTSEYIYAVGSHAVAHLTKAIWSSKPQFVQLDIFIGVGVWFPLVSNSHCCTVYTRTSFVQFSTYFIWRTTYLCSTLHHYYSMYYIWCKCYVALGVA